MLVYDPERNLDAAGYRRAGRRSAARSSSSSRASRTLKAIAPGVQRSRRAPAEPVPSRLRCSLPAAAGPSASTRGSTPTPRTSACAGHLPRRRRATAIGLLHRRRRARVARPDDASTARRVVPARLGRGAHERRRRPLGQRRARPQPARRPPHAGLVPAVGSATARSTGPPDIAALTPGWVTPVMLLLVRRLRRRRVWRGRRFGPLVVENLPVVVRAGETREGRARLYQRSSARLRAADALRIGDDRPPGRDRRAARRPRPRRRSRTRSPRSPADRGAVRDVLLDAHPRAPIAT